MKMEVAVFLPYHAKTDSEALDLYDRMLDLAIHADEAGFGYVWTPEHHLIRFLASPSALITAVQIGQHVKCRVGTAVIVLPYHAPLQLAGEIAASDQAVGGRLEVGVARGAYRYEFDAFGLDFAAGKQHFIEVLQSLEKLLLNSDESTSFSGDIVNFDDAYIWPRPKQSPMPPMWIGAQTMPSIEDAAFRGYHVMHSGFLWDEEHIRNVVAAFRKGLERREGVAGPRPKLMISRYAAVADNEREVQMRLEDLLEHWRVHKQLHDYTQGPDNGRGVIEPRVQQEEPTLEEMRRNVLIGTEGELFEKADFYRNLGVDVLSVNPGFGIPHDVSKSTLDVIAKAAAQ
jgi:alkanesulfonate monooxygenase SsuD/methylene tetrahydromethanopterin reductase-like flavin-dependent oxidoreductase (luciferase family)